NAINFEEGKIRIHILAHAIDKGKPKIEIEYNGKIGPNVEWDCVDRDGTNKCVIPTARIFDFGNITMGTTSSAILTIRNLAECSPFEGVDSCGLCQLRIADNTSEVGYRLGLGFKEGTNDAGYFSFVGNSQTPALIKQRNIEECDESGEVRLLINFEAPAAKGEFKTVIIIESSDVEKAIIELPVIAHAGYSPVAVARLRDFDPEDPGSPYSDPDKLEPLKRIYFDGRKSYDPTDPTDPALIESFFWEIIDYPQGVSPTLFASSESSSDVFSFRPVLAGHYTVQLTVWNKSGSVSANTPSSLFDFDALPASQLYVELLWNNSTSNQDIHLTLASRYDRLCHPDFDCYSLNEEPVWFKSFLAGEGPNPRLVSADTNGLDPEILKIQTPESGTYGLYIHFADTQEPPTPTVEAVHIWLNGIVYGPYQRTLSITDHQNIWAVGDIVWDTNGAGAFINYPSDQEGKIGAVDHLEECASPGWAFP
ncbi:PKD domain-containing protein, partial [Myxococcota bacterium]|nr:PKD domain-containing protein [Myxococcota bacterium]